MLHRECSGTNIVAPLRNKNECFDLHVQSFEVDNTEQRSIPKHSFRSTFMCSVAHSNKKL